VGDVAQGHGLNRFSGRVWHGEHESHCHTPSCGANPLIHFVLLCPASGNEGARYRLRGSSNSVRGAAGGCGVSHREYCAKTTYGQYELVFHRKNRRQMPHRIPRLNAIAVTLAELATEATEMGELQLAKLLVDAMHEAQYRSTDLRAAPSANT
jgi:hypothetical protein